MKNTIYTLLCIYLCVIMMDGGFDKFHGNSLTTESTIIKLEKYNIKDHSEILQKILYISGMKQTGYLWYLIGICEVLFGLLLCFTKTRFLAGLLLLPITLNILLFHVFLECDDIMKLFHVSLLFAINLFVLIVNKHKLKLFLVE